MSRFQLYLFGFILLSFGTVIAAALFGLSVQFVGVAFGILIGVSLLIGMLHAYKGPHQQ